MSFKQILMAVATALMLVSSAAAQAACSQAQLGTAAKPLKWNIRANAPSGFVDCTMTIRGRYDVRGTCFAEGVAATSIRRDKSNVALSSTCVLSGRLDSPGVLSTLRGKFGSGTVVGGANGTLMRLRPSSDETFFFLWVGLAK